MAQDTITLSWTRDGVEVVASATYSDNERTDGHWACEITRPAHVDYKRSTQLGVLQELEDMVDLTHDDLEREREAKAKQTEGRDDDGRDRSDHRHCRDCRGRLGAG